MKTINKFIFIMILVVSLPIIVYSQTNQVFELKPKFSNDTTLNQFIIHWLKKPYKLGGSTERGIDCSQFNKRLSADVYKIAIENTCMTQWETTERIKKDSLQVGDLIFFKSKVSPSKWHCGTYIGETMFVHASNKYEGVKISSLDEPNYKKAYRGAGRTKK
jgi:lipoprotein Spr